MFSNARHFLSQCNTRLRLLYLRSITRKCYYVFMKLPGNQFRILYFVPDSVSYKDFSKAAKDFSMQQWCSSLLCSVNIFPKYIILAVQLEKKQLCEETTLPFLGRLPIPRISCLIVNKCRCVKKMESTSTWNERNITEANICCKIGLNYVGESSRKSSVKQCPWNLVFM